MYVVTTSLEESKKFLATMEVGKNKNKREKKEKQEETYFANKCNGILKPGNKYMVAKLQNTHQTSCCFFWIIHQFLNQKNKDTLNTIS